VPAYAASKPAGGAEISQVIIATVGALVLTGGLMAIVVGHRSGKFKGLDKLGALAERTSGLPGWADLPGTLLGGALIIAVFGMYWDVSFHLDKGRDPGPLANPAHYFILFGLFGVFFAGVIAIALPRRGVGPTGVRLPNGWRAPVGGLMILACGATSLIAFPMDDIWHRIFGQDVTLWGPTHLMLIGGAALSTLGAWALFVEGIGARAKQIPLPTLTRLTEVSFAGAFLIGLSTFQDEFDMTVPQFRLAFHPILIMLAAGIALTAARIRIGRGGALGAVAIFILVRGALALLVGPVLGRTTPHFPPYIVEALAVEAVGFAFVAVRSRPITFGALAGIAIGTVGLAAEWGWTHVWYSIPWTSALFPEGAILGFLMAVCGGVVGGFIGWCLTPGEPGRGALPKLPAATGAIGVVAILGYTLPMTGPDEKITATVQTTDVKPAPNREISAKVKISPASASDDAEWVNVTGWQGGGSVMDPLKKTGPGTFETTKSIPVYGSWKTTLRLHKNREVLGLPIFMPADTAIPVKEIKAPQSFTRPFVKDKQNLQREQKKGVSGALTLIGYLTVLAIELALIAFLAWGLLRVGRLAGKRTEDRAAAGV
jgi:hypothetical protein